MKDLLSPSIPAVEDLFPRTVIQPVSILLTAGFLLAAGPACADGVFRTGLEVAASNGFKALRGRKVGVVTNPTGVDRGLVSIIDLLAKAKGVELKAVFGPEPGTLTQSVLQSESYGPSGNRPPPREIGHLRK